MTQSLDYAPPERDALPAALRVVAWTFIGLGIAGMVGMVISIIHGNLFMDLGAINILAGRGLLQRRRGWRTYSLIYLWAMMLLWFAAFLACLKRAPVLIPLPGGALPVPLYAFAVAPLAILFAAVVGYRILTRPDIRMLFLRRQSLLETTPEEAAAALAWMVS